MELLRRLFLALLGRDWCLFFQMEVSVFQKGVDRFVGSWKFENFPEEIAMNEILMQKRVFHVLEESFGFWVSLKSVREEIEQMEMRKIFFAKGLDDLLLEVLSKLDFCGHVSSLCFCGVELFRITEEGSWKWHLMQGLSERREGEKRSFRIPARDTRKSSRNLGCIPDQRNPSGVRSDVEYSRVPLLR